MTADGILCLLVIKLDVWVLVSNFRKYIKASYIHVSSLEHKKLPCVIFSAIIISFWETAWRKEGRSLNSSGDVFLPHTKQNSIWVSTAPCLQHYLLPLSSVGTRSPPAKRSLHNFRLVACHVHCEISRSGDKHTSFWWHTRHAVRNSVSGIVHIR